MKSNCQYKCIAVEGEDNPAYLGTAIEDNIEVSFNVFVRDNNVVVENAETTNSEIEVFDINGRIVAKSAANSNRIEIPMRAQGVYIVRVGNVAKRVVVN